MGISLFGEIVNPQSEQEMRWGSRKLFTSLNSRLVLSETISSEDYFWGNQANLTFDTAVTLSNKGLFCLRANVHAPKTTCPFPDVRARASGVAIVNIPLEEVAIHVNGWRNASTTKLEGCVWLPVVGTYYLDMNLVHCSINSMTKGNIDAQDLKGRCPIQPVVRPVQEFTFRLDRIERSHQDMELMLDNPRPYVGAWVLAPVCRGSLHRVGKDCTAQSGRKPLMLRTMFQHDTFLQQGGYRSFHDKRLVQRLQDYVFLPTHVVTGEPDYSDGRHATRYYAPPPRPDLSPDTLADKVCILGDSHARYLYAQLVAILEGTTANTTGCQGGMDIKRGILPQKSGNYTLLYEQMEWATTWLQSRSAVRGTLRSCDVIFVSNGHWDAVSTRLTALFFYPSACQQKYSRCAFLERGSLVVSPHRLWHMSTTCCNCCSIWNRQPQLAVSTFFPTHPHRWESTCWNAGIGESHPL